MKHPNVESFWHFILFDTFTFHLLLLHSLHHLICRMKRNRGLLGICRIVLLAAASFHCAPPHNTLCSSFHAAWSHCFWSDALLHAGAPSPLPPYTSCSARPEVPGSPLSASPPFFSWHPRPHFSVLVVPCWLLPGQRIALMIWAGKGQQKRNVLCSVLPLEENIHCPWSFCQQQLRKQQQQLQPRQL